MTHRSLAAAIAAALLLALPLSGCGIPGGIAYAIKEGGKEMNKSGQNSDGNAAQSQTQTSAEAPPDPNPPPAPTAAPRDSIDVEPLK